ncbi:recombinase family protein [Streptomyces sp. NPDC059524]|uniref:recombinase family protein n=1 Tax=Streptomyces sp. NPDC059524 TaxID=3346856 RepID=UPI0036A717A6
MSILAFRPRAGEQLVVVTYRRVSTQRQLDGSGLEEQRADCLRWLRSHPEVELADDYVDEAMSGTGEERPGLERLMNDARGGAFQRVIVASVDRVGRTAQAAYQWAWGMADLGVHIIAVREGIDTSTETGWEDFRRWVTYADLEWRRIRQRTMAGRESTISYGGWPSGPPPFGYRIVPGTVQTADGRRALSILVTDEREAAVIQEAAALLIEAGMNCRQAADELNRRGWSTRSGAPWSAANLRSRLSGETIHHGYVTYRKAGRAGRPNTTRRTETGEPLHGAALRIGVPPILSEDRAGQLMVALRQTGFRNGRREDRVYPLSGRITGQCGEAYTGATEGDRRVYRCRGRLAKTCRDHNLRADEMDAAVLHDVVGLILDQGPVVDALLCHWTETASGDRTSYEQRVQDFDRSIAEHERMLEDSVPASIEAGIPPQIMEAAATKIRERLHDLHRQKAVAVRWLGGDEGGRTTANALVHGIRNGSVDEGGMPPELASALFEALDVRVRPTEFEDGLRSGVRCPVTEWHRSTGMLIPPDPTERQWESVLNVLRPLFTARHFTSRHDIRLQFCGMLHRLRRGLSWRDMPDTWGPVDPIRVRQLNWWKKGAWPQIMKTLGAESRGEPVPCRPVLPSFVLTTGVGDGGAAEKPMTRRDPAR